MVRYGLAAVGLFAAAGTAGAQIVSPVSASTNMGSGFGTLLTNTINGMGLSSLALNATHDSTIPSNSWVSMAPTLTGQVTFTLPGLRLIDGSRSGTRTTAARGRWAAPGSTAWSC